MKEKMYNEFAKYYDLLYQSQGKDYEAEAKKLKAIIRKYKKSEGNDLLDVACGTGMHLQYLKDSFDCTGVDINQGMLKIAKKKLPKVTFIHGDMSNFKINKKFDVITCLFSSIGYAKTYSKLRKTLQNFSNHLNPGGVLIIEPWFTKSQLTIGMPFSQTYKDKNTIITRTNISKLKGNVSIFDFHFLIAERGKEVKHIVDKNELGIFEIKPTLNLMKKAGLHAKFSKKGLNKRGFYMGVKK